MGSAKDEHGVREKFAKEDFLFAKNGRLRIREFRSFPMYVICIYYIYRYEHQNLQQHLASKGPQIPPGINQSPWHRLYMTHNDTTQGVFRNVQHRTLNVDQQGYDASPCRLYHNLHTMITIHWCIDDCIKEHFLFLPYIGNNNPSWLSYFSEGLKPPTSDYMNHQGVVIFLNSICIGIETQRSISNELLPEWPREANNYETSWDIRAPVYSNCTGIWDDMRSYC